jgi:hypothetical protein
MFGFLKRLFGGTGGEIAAGPAAATIRLAELDGWLEQSRASARAQLAEQASAARARVNEVATAARAKVEALQSASLMNPDIPERAKDFMQGNREEYCRRVLQYLDTLVIPEADRLQEFFSRHAQDAAAFTQAILRPFQILQEFFSHESKEITLLLAQAEQEIQALSSLHAQSKPDAELAARDAFRAFVAKQEQRRALEDERTGLERQRDEASQAIVALNSEEERLLKDPARQAALQKLSDAQRAVQSHEQKARALFAQFEPALRVFKRMATRHVKLLERYLADPVRALVDDLHLDYLDIVADIQRLLTFDRLPLGDKRAAVLEVMPMMGKEYLGTWMREYGQVAKAEKDAQAAVEQCAASQKLARIQRLREETRRNLQLAEQRISHAQKGLGNIDLAALKDRLEQKLSDLHGAPVSVTF